MLKKTIVFKDLDGNELTEDFYFNLSAAEIAEMELSQDGGLGERLQEIVKDQDGSAIILMFKKILSKAYGQRSDDGRRFIKSDLISEEFMQTDAYSVLFLELVTNAEASADFVGGIIPADLQGKLEKITDVPLPDEPVQNKLNELVKQAGYKPTQKELSAMSREELLDAFKRREMVTDKSPHAPQE